MIAWDPVTGGFTRVEGPDGFAETGFPLPPTPSHGRGARHVAGGASAVIMKQDPKTGQIIYKCERPA